MSDKTERALTQVKSVDDAYPLVGSVVLDPPLTLAAALSGQGAVMDRVLADRLGLSPGQTFSLGDQDFTLKALLEKEPDNVAGGFAMGDAAADPDSRQWEQMFRLNRTKNSLLNLPK